MGSLKEDIDLPIKQLSKLGKLGCNCAHYLLH